MMAAAMERRDQNGNLLGLTIAEADEKLEDLTLPRGAKRAEAKLELMAKRGGGGCRARDSAFSTVYFKTQDTEGDIEE